jgi:hypothetical protein
VLLHQPDGRRTVTTMTVEALKDAFAENRFPLTLCLADGQRVQVKHRDYMFVPPNGLVVVVADDQGGFRTIDTALVTELPWRGRVKAA